MTSKKTGVRHLRTVVYILLLALPVPLTVFLAQQEQQLRSSAQSTTGTTTPSFYPLAPCPTCVDPSTTPELSGVVAPTGYQTAPCTSDSSIADELDGDDNNNKDIDDIEDPDQENDDTRHKKKKGGVSKGMEELIKLFIELLNMLLKLLGGGEIIVPTQPTPEDPNPQPLPSTTAPTTYIPNPSLAPCPAPTTTQPSSMPSTAQPSMGAQPSTAQTPPPVGKRIAYSADGNQHDDDDWASVASVFAILGHKGMQANLVHLDYNNHIWDSNAKGPGEMRASVNGAVQRWGFNATNVFDDLTQKDAAQVNLVEEINKSTASDELWLSLAGPMETAYQALNAANPEARKHVKCVSHGENSFNQTHAKTEHGGHSYDDLIGLGCQRVQIPNQNSKMGPTDVSYWNFLKASSDPNYQWLYTRFEPASQSRGDISDAGMVWYTVTENQNGSRDDVKNLFLSPPAAPKQ